MSAFQHVSFRIRDFCFALYGVPHRDVLDKNGRILRKDWLVGMTFEEALTHAKDDLLHN